MNDNLRISGASASTSDTVSVTPECYDGNEPAPQRCLIDGKSLEGKRRGTLTCSPRCRKALSRQRTQLVHVDGATDFDFEAAGDAFEVDPEVQSLFDDDRQRFASMYGRSGGSTKQRAARKGRSKAARDADRDRRYDAIAASFQT